MTPLDPATLARDAEAPTKETNPDEVRGLVKIAQEMQATKAMLDEAKEEVSRLQAQYDHFRKEEIPERMQKAGLVAANGRGSFTLPDGTTVFLQGDMHVSIRKEDQERFHAWLRKNGNEDLISETVWWQTQRAFFKELLGRGETPPPFVQAHQYLVARTRKPSQ